MLRCWMGKKGFIVLAVFYCCTTLTAATWRLKDGEEWQSVTTDPREEYLHAIAELKDLVRNGDAGALKDALAQLKDDFPQYVGPDVDLFMEGELQFWRDRYNKAMSKYEKLLKESPGSEFAAPAMDREFDIAKAYLDGRKKTVLGFIRISGHAEGVEIMERLSDRDGLDDPNGVGLRAAVAVAESYEARAKAADDPHVASERYLEGYLKWSEIASYWETGPIGKQALLRMAEDNLAAYIVHPPQKRTRFDASKLTSAKTYYEKFLARYPEDARRLDVPQKLKEIGEQMAYKQLAVGQYYQRLGRTEAASFYFETVVKNWPDTPAGETALAALKEYVYGGQAREE